MASNDVCEHQNGNYLRMMSERDALRAEVERLREGIFAAATVLNREFYRLPAAWVGRLAADLRALLSGSGEYPGEVECEECEAIARMIYSDPSDLAGPCSRHSHDRPAPVVPDGGNAHEPGDDEHTPGVNVTQPAIPDSTDVWERVRQALRESRRTGLGGMTEAQALDHMTDAVLTAAGPLIERAVGERVAGEIERLRDALTDDPDRAALELLIEDAASLARGEGS